MPSSYTFGWYIFERNVISGGWFGKSSGNCIIALKIPPSYGVSAARRGRAPTGERRDFRGAARRRKDERRRAAALEAPPTLPPTRSACARRRRRRRPCTASAAFKVGARKKSGGRRRPSSHHRRRRGRRTRRPADPCSTLRAGTASDSARRRAQAVEVTSRPGCGAPGETPGHRCDPTLAAAGSTHRAVAA